MGRTGHTPWNKGLKGVCGGWNRGMRGVNFRKDDSYLLGNQHAKGHKPNTTCFKKGIIPWNKGTKGVMKAWNKGIPRTPEQIEYLRKFMLGRPAPYNTGEKSHFWKGGICREPYTAAWTWALRNRIRVRDNYTCRICGKSPAKSVHHINYNKTDCREENLATLCRRCHSLTTMNRQRWLAFFNNKNMQVTKSNQLCMEAFVK